MMRENMIWRLGLNSCLRMKQMIRCTGVQIALSDHRSTWWLRLTSFLSCTQSLNSSVHAYSTWMLYKHCRPVSWARCAESNTACSLQKHVNVSVSTYYFSRSHTHAKLKSGQFTAAKQSYQAEKYLLLRGKEATLSSSDVFHIACPTGWTSFVSSGQLLTCEVLRTLSKQLQLKRLVSPTPVCDVSGWYFDSIVDFSKIG